MKRPTLFLATTFVLCLTLDLAAQTPAVSTTVLCMYDAPLGEMRKGVYPAYPGSAWSTDGGTTWRQSGLLTSMTNDVARSSSGTHHFLATDLGLFVSTDTGRTWSQHTDGSMGAALCVLPTANALWLGTAVGIYMSTDAGRTWELRTNGLPALDGTYVSALAGNESTLLAGTAAGVYVSTNQGRSWQPTPMREPVQHLITNTAAPQTIATVTEAQTLHISTDAGATWTETMAGLPARAVTAFAFHPTDPSVRLVAIAQHGVMRSTDAGRTWSYVNGGITNLHLTALGFDPANPTTAYAGSGSGAYISRDGASTWSYSDVRLGYVSAIRFFAER